MGRWPQRVEVVQKGRGLSLGALGGSPELSSGSDSRQFPVPATLHVTSQANRHFSVLAGASSLVLTSIGPTQVERSLKSVVCSRVQRALQVNRESPGGQMFKPLGSRMHPRAK